MRHPPSVRIFSTLIVLLLGCGLQEVRAADHSLHFHGTGRGGVDRILIPLARSDGLSGGRALPADVGATDFTLEFWVRGLLEENPAPGTACGSGAHWIYGNTLFDRDPGGALGRFGISFGAGRLSFGVTNEREESRTICGNTTILDGEWHHVAIQRQLSDGRLSIHVDGVPDARGEGPPGDISSAASEEIGAATEPYLVIGAESRDAGPSFPAFRGWIDEVRISRSLRYRAAFDRPQGPFAIDSQTVALYHLDEGAGEKVFDSAGAAGGPSHGLRRFGGSPSPGPRWSRETPFAAAAPAASPFAGLPGGGVLEAYPNPELGQTILFARFPEPREGEATVTIRDDAGRIRGEITETLQRGSAMFVWDGTSGDGSRATAGSYSARLETGGRSLSARFTLR